MIQYSKTLKQNRCCVNDQVAFTTSKTLKVNDQNVFVNNEAGLTLEYLGAKSSALKINNFAYQLKNTRNTKLISMYSEHWEEKMPYDWDPLTDPTSCLFMEKLYILGGTYHESKVDDYFATDECYVYDPKNGEWNRICSMQKGRYWHSCAVFGGKIVVTGGVHGRRKSVEAYDHFKNTWTYMTRLTEERQNHGSVSMGNKLYVIGGVNTQNCEVLDYISNKFVRIARLPLLLTLDSSFEMFRVKNRIFVKIDGAQHATKENIYIYNTTTDKWTSACIKMFEEFPCISIVHRC